MFDAKQMRQIGMAARLHQHAFARIDQNNSAVGGRCASDHVAGILFMARRIGDDEFALLGREEAVSDIDGDALFALCGEAIDQQCKIDFLPLRTDFLLSASSAAS